jgi:lipopolysaccharide transport system permease protein
MVTVATSVFVVGKVLGISTEPVPLVLFTILGLSLWTLFNRGLRHGTRAMTRGRALIRRVSFPRIMLIGGSLAPTLIEFAVVFAGALATFGYYAYGEAFIPVAGWRIFSIVPVSLMVIAIVIAVSCVTSVFNNIASDTALSVNYATSVLFIATPVVYPLSALPEKWQWAVLLNPLAPVMEIWRWAFLGTPLPPGWAIAYAVAVTIALLIGGLTFFSRWEQTILDRS